MGKCPGQVHVIFESYLPTAQAGIQIFFNSSVKKLLKMQCFVLQNKSLKIQGGRSKMAATEIAGS